MDEKNYILWMNYDAQGKLWPIPSNILDATGIHISGPSDAVKVSEFKRLGVWYVNEPSSGCTSSRLRILLVTLATPKASAVSQYSVMINTMYAKRWGYDIMTHACVTDTNLDHTWDEDVQYRANWDKPNILARHLKEYHYLVYVDSDMYFNNFSISMESFIDKYLQHRHSVAMYDNKPWGKANTSVNCGFIVVKNDRAGSTMLEVWRHAYRLDVCSRFKYTHPREQECLISLLREKRAYFPSLPRKFVNILDSDTRQENGFLKHHFTASKGTFNVIKEIYEDLQNHLNDSLVYANKNAANDTSRKQN
jgi:hypothetical protein